jgi:hypothetical protein
MDLQSYVLIDRKRHKLRQKKTEESYLFLYSDCRTYRTGYTQNFNLLYLNTFYNPTPHKVLYLSHNAVVA